MGQAVGFGRRFAADFLDSIIFIVPIAIFLYFLTGKFSFEWTNSFLWNIIYAIYLTIVPVLWKGFIIGKRICNIRIKQIDESQVDLYHMFLREIVGKILLSYVTFGVATIVSIFMVIFREDKRAIHDFIAGTYVAYEDSI
ncbi:RDD family protein [Heyndrickxia sp. NPDC080065]|uniref:RDD family protein n=1 Tax=Heyndrickxia sp. NPDC080065 TaxID=3390568 RepID=UPI003CFE91A2